MFNSVVEMLKACKIRTFILERPKELPSKLNEYAVIDMPVAVKRPFAGYDNFRYSTKCVIYLFCRAKNDNTANIDAQSATVKKVFDCFPYKDNVCECVRPEVLHRGSDEYGFQVTTITFTLRTKINSITNL